MASGKPTFDDLYETLYAYGFEVTDTPESVYCRPGVERRCWSCGKAKPEATFRKDAHVIPAWAGNRSFFSLEECDVCNQRWGDTVDNALAEYLSLWRAVSRIRKRSGGVKLRKGGHESYVAGDPSNNRLEVMIDEREDSVQVEALGDGEAILRMSVPQSSPVSASKAIARIAYMCLPDDDRRGCHTRNRVGIQRGDPRRIRSA